MRVLDERGRGFLGSGVAETNGRFWSLEWDLDASMRSGKGTRQTKHDNTQEEISQAKQNKRK